MYYKVILFNLNELFYYLFFLFKFKVIEYKMFVLLVL